MIEESRTKNTIKNVKTGAIVQIINKLMAFIVRTVFIKMLNSEYLGINGLFTNILTILSFTELGIGTAIIFNMYKPIAIHDNEKLKSLMKLYKKCYIIIGCIVFFLGILVIPFMGVIIKETPKIKENINCIYILFLFNTASSYFFTYKKSIISAYQKQSIINNIDSLFYLIKSILEIIFLIITRNYIVYLIIQILGTLLENIVLAKKADKMFPFIKEKNVKALDKKEKKGILSNVKSLVVYKFGTVIMNGTDNILISSLVNVETVGLCSNYTLIIQSVKSVVETALNGVTASVGNLNAVASNEQKKDIFYQLTFINYLIYSFCAIAFIILLNPFIALWLGNEYVLNIGVSISLAISFWVEGLRNPGYIFRTTLGLFEKGKITPYIGAIANIVISIILCKCFGVVGIFIGTTIAQLVSYSWIDPYLIHKYSFKTSFKEYLKKYIIYAVVFAIELFMCLFINSYIRIDGIMKFIMQIIIVVIVPNTINLLVFYKTQEYNSLKDKFIYPLVRKLRKR